MSSNAKKLPYDMKPRMVNCDPRFSFRSFLIAKGNMRFFFDSGEKTRLYRQRSNQEKCASWSLTKKNCMLPLPIKKNALNHNLLSIIFFFYTIIKICIGISDFNLNRITSDIFICEYSMILP